MSRGACSLLAGLFLCGCGAGPNIEGVTTRHVIKGQTIGVGYAAPIFDPVVADDDQGNGISVFPFREDEGTIAAFEVAQPASAAQEAVARRAAEAHCAAFGGSLGAGLGYRMDSRPAYVFAPCVAGPLGRSS